MPDPGTLGNRVTAMEAKWSSFIDREFPNTMKSLERSVVEQLRRNEDNTKTSVNMLLDEFRANREDVRAEMAKERHRREEQGERIGDLSDSQHAITSRIATLEREDVNHEHRIKDIEEFVAEMRSMHSELTGALKLMRWVTGGSLAGVITLAIAVAQTQGWI